MREINIFHITVRWETNIIKIKFIKSFIICSKSNRYHVFSYFYTGWIKKR